MTLQSAVRVSYADLKYKTYDDIQELIGLDVLYMFTFTPYYDPSPPSWDVVENSVSSLWCVP